MRNFRAQSFMSILVSRPDLETHSSRMCGEVFSSSARGTLIAVLALCYLEMRRSSLTTCLEFRLLLKPVSSEVGLRMGERED